MHSLIFIFTYVFGQSLLINENIGSSKNLLSSHPNSPKHRNNDETDDESESSKFFSGGSSNEQNKEDAFEPEARTLKNTVQITDKHSKKSQKKKSSAFPLESVNDLEQHKNIIFGDQSNSLNSVSDADDQLNGHNKPAQLLDEAEDAFLTRHSKKEKKETKKAVKVDLLAETKNKNNLETSLMKSLGTEEPVSQFEIDIHTLIPMHNEKSKSKMYDLVKNVNSYTDFNLLMAAQLILPKTDSKDFVDRPTKRPISEISKDFKKLSKKLGLKDYTSLILNEKETIEYNEDESSDEDVTTRAESLSSIIAEYAIEVNSISSKNKTKMLMEFIEENFGEPGSDLEPHELEDWKSEPVLLHEKDLQGKKITNKNVQDVIIGLNDVWKELSRKKIERKGQDSTLLSLPYPFIVPGGRFREFYYWDTYFILEGLVKSKMYKTAFNIVRNFAHIIKTLGYIPNGTREYYKFRSQPAFFPLMLVKILGINEEMDNFILTEGLDMALKEYNWFKSYRSINVRKNNKTYNLNYFHVKTDFPRPESLSEDIKTFLNQSSQSEDEMYSNIKSGAESGWDFSSRWFVGSNMETIVAYHQIPVDLNAILYKDEQIISMLLEKNGMTERAKEFGDLAEKRYKAINEVLWNDEVGAWNDLRLSDNSFVDKRFYFSNVFPLIFDILPPAAESHRKSFSQNGSNLNRMKQHSSFFSVLNVYKKELFSYKGGVPVSGEGSSEQQWDFPNVWAPHQFLIVDKLVSVGETELALQIARAFYNSVKAGFVQNGVFYEKYNCIKLGLTGKGGEYEAQTGFGWTNGTALSFIKMFGDSLDTEYDVQNEFDKISEYLAMKISGTEKRSIEM